MAMNQKPSLAFTSNSLGIARYSPRSHVELDLHRSVKRPLLKLVDEAIGHSLLTIICFHHGHGCHGGHSTGLPFLRAFHGHGRCHCNGANRFDQNSASANLGGLTAALGAPTAAEVVRFFDVEFGVKKRVDAMEVHYSVYESHTKTPLMIQFHPMNQ